MSESEPQEQTESDVQNDMDEAEERKVAPQDVEAGQGGGSLLDFIGNGGIEQMLLKEQYVNEATGHTYSQADLIADVVNVLRMDAKQIAAMHGVEVEANKMSSERAAQLMAAVAGDSGGVDLIEVFQDIENKNDATLQKLMDEGQHEAYMAFKEDMLNSVASDE